MSDPHSTRSADDGGNPYYRAYSREAIALVRAGVDPTLPQRVALERIGVRLHGRANRHDLGEWREDPTAPAGEVVACSRCGARAYLSSSTAVANVAELLEACK